MIVLEEGDSDKNMNIHEGENERQTHTSPKTKVKRNKATYNYALRKIEEQQREVETAFEQVTVKKVSDKKMLMYKIGA